MIEGVRGRVGCVVEGWGVIGAVRTAALGVGLAQPVGGCFSLQELREGLERHQHMAATSGCQRGSCEAKL